MNSDYIEIMGRFTRTFSQSSIRPGVDTAKQLANLFGNPQDKFRSIHIAGTNGKGSVTTKIAKALSLQGYRCGVYTSPHISCFRERIRINDTLISEQELVDVLRPVLEIVNKEGVKVSFFEITTLIAFLYFASKQVDFAVIEVGIGGRLDATNILTPLLSVITSIDLDHTSILGKTIEEIAVEKAGIIKNNVPVVLGPHLPSKILQQVAIAKNSPIIVQNLCAGKYYDMENSATARLALQQLSLEFPLSSKSIQEGILVRPNCRFEILQYKGCKVILDVAHNAHGISQLIRMLGDFYPQKKVHWIIGFSKDKGIEPCIDLIISHAASINAIETNFPRLRTATEVIELFAKRVFVKQVKAVSEVYAELESPEEIIVVCGSFYIMSQIRTELGIIEPIDPNFWFPRKSN